LLFGAALSGCYSPSLYQTPRTLAPGKAAATLAIEPSFCVTNEGATDNPRLSASRWPALLMVYRYGVAKGFDLSASLTGPAVASGAVMGKIQILRNDDLDIALMPRLSGGAFYQLTPPYGRCTGSYCEPVVHLDASAIALFGWNIHPDATLVVAPGFVQSFAPDTKRGFRLTLGLQLRITKDVSIHPEVTYMPTPLGLSSDSKGWFAGIGIGARGGGDGYAR
jgi:hypothetical protein